MCNAGELDLDVRPNGLPTCDNASHSEIAQEHGSQRPCGSKAGGPVLA
jgi:hypothetical protein